MSVWSIYLKPLTLITLIVIVSIEIHSVIRLIMPWMCISHSSSLYLVRMATVIIERQKIERFMLLLKNRV